MKPYKNHNIKTLVKNEKDTELKLLLMELKNSFKKKAFSKESFSILSVLDYRLSYLLSSNELIRFYFPTTISSLYGKTDADYSDCGMISFLNKGKAEICFITNNHSIEKHKRSFQGKRKLITGTYKSVVRFYLKYLKELSTIP